MITQIKSTYLVTDDKHRRTFEYWVNGITIPWKYDKTLTFKNSKKSVVTSFYKALGEFLDEIKKNDPKEQGERVIYKWLETKPLEAGMSEWIINHHNWVDYTFVRDDWIIKSFEITEVQDFKNRKDATVYLKQLFGKYKDEYPELFDHKKTPDWSQEGSSKLFPMIYQRATDNDIPYAGWQDSDGEHCWPGRALCAWLPVRVGGNFACVWSSSDDRRADFFSGNEGIARLSVSFKS